MALLGGGYTWSSPIIGGWVGNITSTYGSWASYNTSYLRWVLPAAGTYELHANLRVRAWGSTGFTKFRVLRNSDNSAVGGAYGGSADTVQPTKLSPVLTSGFRSEHRPNHHGIDIGFKGDYGGQPMFLPDRAKITGNGFDIDIKNGSSIVNRNFKYTAVGFGRGS